MKSMAAIEIMVIKLLKKNDVKLKGDVVFAGILMRSKAGKKGQATF